MKPKIYIASSWKNEKIVKVLAYNLRHEGFKVDCFADNSTGRYVFHWSEIGVPEEIDAKSFLKDERSQKAFEEDRKWLDWADIVIMILPCGRSSHLEAGYSVGSGKQLYIYAPNGFVKGEFDVMYGFARGLFDNYHDLRMELLWVSCLQEV